jgi:hypothetical protein
MDAANIEPQSITVWFQGAIPKRHLRSLTHPEWNSSISVRGLSDVFPRSCMKNGPPGLLGPILVSILSGGRTLSADQN